MRLTAAFRLLRIRSISAFSKSYKPQSIPLELPSCSFCLTRQFPPNRDRLSFTTAGGAPDYSKEVNEINFKYTEAREEIEAAMESKETIYFDEEAECTREAVKAVPDMFEGLRGSLPEKDQKALQRSMGLKIEQLKAELKQLED